jgi:hypothetical protein
MVGGSGRRLWLPPVRWTIRRRLIGERWRRRGHRVAGGSEWTLGHAAPAREVRRSRVIGDILIFPLFRFAHCFYYPRRLRAGSVVITVVLAGAGRVNQAAQENQQTDRFPRLASAYSICREGLCYWTSAIRALPIMTSGIPLVNSRTLFLTHSAAVSLEAIASSALSNMLMVISTSGPPSSR